MSVEKDPQTLFAALVTIAKGNLSSFDVKDIAKKAIATYSAGDVLLTVKSGVANVTAPLFTRITKRSKKLSPTDYTTAYTLDIPFDTTKEYRNVCVEYHNGEKTHFILQTPKGTSTAGIKENLKDEGLGWYLKNNPSFGYWPVDEVSKTELIERDDIAPPSFVLAFWKYRTGPRYAYLVE